MRAVTLNPVELNNQIITAADGWGEWRDKIAALESIWTAHWRAFNHVNTATFVHRLGKALPPHQTIPDSTNQILADVDSTVLRFCNSLNPQGLVNITVGYSKLRRAPAAVLEALTASAFKENRAYDALALVPLLHAHAVLRSPTGELESGTLRDCKINIQAIARTPKFAANILWSLACLQSLHTKEIAALIMPHLAPVNCFHGDNLIQLRHSALAADLTYPSELMAATSSAASYFAASRSQPDDFAKSVALLFSSLGRAVEQKAPIEGYTAQFLLYDSQPETVVEILGDTHSLSGSPTHKLTGSDAMRRRILEKLQYRVVQIPHAEWLAADDARTLLSAATA